MAADLPLPPPTLPPDQMRRLGYQVVDLVVDALAGLPDRPPSRRAGPEELAGLNEPVTRAGADPEQVLREAVEDVLGPAMRVDHPRIFAYVPIPSNYVGMLADALASGFGVFAGTWQAASGAAAAELATVRWLRELFGLPETADGLFVDGGSSANLYGLVAARRAVLEDRPVAVAQGVRPGRLRRGCPARHGPGRLRRRPAAPPPRLGGGRPDPARPGQLLLRRRVAHARGAGGGQPPGRRRHAGRPAGTLSSTVLGGRAVLRLCTVNPRTTREDVEATLARVEELARSG